MCHDYVVSIYVLIVVDDKNYKNVNICFFLPFFEITQKVEDVFGL